MRLGVIYVLIAEIIIPKRGDCKRKFGKQALKIENLLAYQSKKNVFKPTLDSLITAILSRNLLKMFIFIYYFQEGYISEMYMLYGYR